MDQVDHPNHYNVDGKKECIEEMGDCFGTRITAIFCLTNCYKYLYRAGHKDGTDDIAKAKWYWNYVNEKIDCRVYFYNDVLFSELYATVERMLKEHDQD